MVLTFVFHVLIATLSAYALCWINGSLSAGIAAFSLLFGFWVGRRWAKSVAAAVGPETRILSFGEGLGGWIERVLFLIILFFAYRHFAFMFYVGDKDVRTLALGNFGDLTLHLNYIRVIANGAPWPLTNPGFSPETLRYPFGVNLYSALWEILGVSTQAHLFVFGFLASVASLVLLRAWGGWWAMGAFFFNGGWAGWEWFRTGRFAESDFSLAWKNLFLSVFVTQRGMLCAIPFGLLLLHYARRAFNGDFPPSKTQLRCIGILWGGLALFHLHAFSAVSVTLAGLALIFTARRTSEREGSLIILRRILIWAFPLATFFVLYSTDFFRKSGMGSWRPGWMSGTEGFIAFAAKNFGPWIPVVFFLPFLILTLPIYARDRRQAQGKENGILLLEWIFHLALFTFFLNRMLAPWEWDNIKVLIWPYLGFAAIAHHSFRPVENRLWFGIAQVALAGVLLFSGWSQVSRLSMTNSRSVSIWQLAELASVEGAVRGLPRGRAVIATAPTHDHPIAFFGFRRAIGYPDHLWSHGIKANSALIDLETLMRGAPGWQAAADRLKVTHLFYGPVEKMRYGGIEPAWKSVLSNSSTVSEYEVYEIVRD